MRVAVLATGGTIASRPGSDGYLVVRDTVTDLLAGVRLPAGVTVTGFDVAHRPSFELTLDDMLATVREIRAKLALGFTAVVVTHGTDTLEEAAYLTGQLVPRDARIVFTGAQRSADEPDSDAGRNLSDAITVSAAPEPVGVAVVLGGFAYAAVEARKVHTSALAAFSAGAAGALALVDGDGMLRLSAPARGAYYANRAIPKSLPRVDLIKLAAGADDTHVRASVAAGTAGIVIEAFGAGNATASVFAAVQDACKQGVVVVITSRTGGGRVRPIYASGGADLAHAGAIFGGNLTGTQARVALALSLAMAPADAVPDAFHGMVEGALS